MIKNVGFVSTRFAGTDGVTLEAGKWAEVFEENGNAFLEAIYFKKPMLINRYATFVRDKVKNRSIPNQSGAGPGPGPGPGGL